jgi:hypothetical protein
MQTMDLNPSPETVPKGIGQQERDGIGSTVCQLGKNIETNAQTEGKGPLAAAIYYVDNTQNTVGRQCLKYDALSKYSHYYSTT